VEVVVSGAGAAVSRAVTRLELVVEGGLESLRPTHFVGLRLGHADNMCAQGKDA
jgi:hypothetical protein